MPVPRVGNLADLVRAAGERVPDHPALVHVTGPETESVLTWSAFDADVDAAAAGLREGLGLRTGDRVALMLSNTPAFLTAYVGLLRAGLVAVPVNTGYTAPELAGMLGASAARAIVCDDATTPVAEEAVAGTHRVLVDPAGLESLVAQGRSTGKVTATGAGEDLAVLLFTSGTSGTPRAAMLSHRALLANLDQCAGLVPAPVGGADVVLLVLPLFHIYGLNAGFGMVVAAGATAVLVERFDPVDTAAAIMRHGVTTVPGAPPMYVAWTGADDGALSAAVEALRGPRLLTSGSSPLPPAVLDALRSRTGQTVYEGYGLTETAPVVTSTLASERAKPASIGRPVPGVQIRLLDEAGLPVAEDDPGEIWVCGDNLFSGYWPDGTDGPGADGWWATGDVAYADEDGDLFLVDRRKELILVSGFNVFPREVELALAEHPGVAEVAVIGAAHPTTGETVKAFVVARPGSNLTAADVSAHAARRLARFKTPTLVELVDALPHSATGKVAKGQLRATVDRGAR